MKYEYGTIRIHELYNSNIYNYSLMPTAGFVSMLAALHANPDDNSTSRSNKSMDHLLR